MEHIAIKPHIFWVLVACVLTGCAASEVGTFTSLGPSRMPKPHDYHVDVFEATLPQRPFERVAILDAHCESQWFATPSLQDDVMPELIRQARAAGCDAIIEIQEKHLESPGNFETGAKHYTAIGVVYK